MKFDLNNFWTDTITVINKLPARFTEGKKDLYFKHVLYNCNWHSITERRTNNFDALSSIRVIAQVPRQDNYVPYSKWVYEPHGLTFCVGDYVFLGEILGEIDCDNIGTIVLKYQPNVIKIKSFQDATLPGQFLPKIKNISIAHYYIEGA